MNFMCFMRNRAFWRLDAIRGGSIKKAYDVIKKIDEMDSDDPRISKYQQKAFRRLKEKACQNTVAYKNQSDSELKDFPVITKQDIRENYDAYISSDYKKEELIQMATSGSTGTPFVSYQNAGKKKRVNAETIYYSGKVGYDVGKKLCFIRSIVRGNQKSRLRQFLQNEVLIHCAYLDDKGIETMLSRIENESQNGPVTLLAYASTYTAMKDYYKAHGPEKFKACKVSGCISGSDMLYDETREVIKKAFGGIDVVSRYANEENGFLGQDEGINNVFTINEADYIIEIMDDAGLPLPDGTAGRIVVTDLYNFAMPLIRYDTGDIGAIKVFEINGRKKRCICDFAGRRTDVIYNTNGRMVSPHFITNGMWEFTDLRQFQLIQTGEKSYTLKLNISDDFTRQDQVLKKFKEMLGVDADINLVVVDEIPALSSGKRRYIVNQWKKV